MQNDHSLEDLLDFLSQAGERGLMPAATAQALSVATRNVFSVLDDAERAHLPLDDLDGVIRRFNNKRAREFNPSSLKEYGRRVHRAVEMYQQWKSDPANFSVKTRATSASKQKEKKVNGRASAAPASKSQEMVEQSTTPSTARIQAASTTGYQSAFPVRPGHVVVIDNIPFDLSQSEAERLAQFVRLLAPA
ncbi:MAG: hypothetical protein ACO1Q7_02925 [Gemmatimonas sp.]